MNKVIAIVGPTGSGKSSLGINIAQQLNSEIISGDSIAIYQQLNIGSAKPSKEEQQLVKHHLVDILSIDHSYSVADFQNKGRKIIDQLHQQNKIPIVVGGTGLYIKALLYDYQFEKREFVEDDFDVWDNNTIWNYINDKDQQAANKIHVNNRQRLITTARLLNNIVEGNKTTLLEQQKHEPIYECLIIGLTMDKDYLYQRINQRVDQMMEMGLLNEVEELYKIENVFDLPGLKGIGYKEFKDYYDNNQGLEKTVEEIKKHTRQFAKRQYTWFNNQMTVNWLDINDPTYDDKLNQLLENFIG
ncbi:MAG: tRNA (adenosine(37)-N6)-dimethylallyltransferase MiaA [Erysipelotrichaceae bacterium]